MDLGQEKQVVEGAAMWTKTVSLAFRGFDVAAEEVPRLLGISASSVGGRGQPVKAGVKTLLTRSYSIVSMDFSSDYEFNDMLPALFARLGGIDHLLKIKADVQPELWEIHFDLPVRTSEESQDGFLSEAVIADVFQLKASHSFGFF